MKLLAFCLLLGMSAQGQNCEPYTCSIASSEQTFIGGYIIADSCSFGQKIEVVRKNGDKETLATCGTDGKWWKFRDETDFAQAAQRAADETDGKPQLWIWPDGKIQWIDPKGEPHKPWDEVGPLGDGPNPPWPPYEPIDVPAVLHNHTIRNLGICHSSWAKCIPAEDSTKSIWSCADKSRILEHDENSPAKYWCRKVQP